MEEYIANLWYENGNLRTVILRDGTPISDRAEPVDPEWIGGKLIALASRGIGIRPQNFGFKLTVESKKYER